MRPGGDAKRKKRLAFMLASIHSGSSTKVWPELLSESERRDCSLFVFPGGRLSSRDEYEYMRNGIFELVNAASFDGAVCWASTLSGFASEEQVEEFLLSKVDVPLVTFGLKIGDKPVVNIDTYSGMRQLLAHLIKRHKRRKIAYIGGPRAHSSAQDRYRAYRDALEEAGIAYDERLACRDTAWNAGRKAIATLLDERGLVPGRDFDALCAASDLLAFEAATQLQERGVRIPADLALGGFNDSDESNLFSPTYTTVRMPFERQALQAFAMLFDLLAGKRPADRLLKSRLVLRQSCGCLTESVQLAGAAAPPSGGIPGGEDSAPQGEDGLVRFASGFLKLEEGDAERYLAPVVGAFLGSMGKGGQAGFIEALDLALNDFIFKDRDVSFFQDLLSALRLSQRGDSSPGAAERLETLISQGRVLVSDAEKRRSNYRAWKEKGVDQWFSILNHRLLCAKDFEAIVTIAGRCLPEMGILSGRFVLNGKDQGHRIFLGGFEAKPGAVEPKQIAERPLGAVELRLNRRAFPSSLLLPEDLYPAGPGSYVALPLHDESTSIGYMILKLQKSEASIYEELRSVFASAMRGVLLFEQANEARRRAEKAERMKTEFLAGISGELQQPIGLIHETAARLLAEVGEPSHRAWRDDIEAIAASSARQMELTGHLLELSLAQVDDFALHPSLFDPRRFAEAFAAEAPSRHRRKKWGPVTVAKAPAAPPLAWADRDRLGQVLGIFLDCLFRDLGAPSAEISLGISPEGIVFSAASPLREAAANKLGAIREILQARPGLASLDHAKIELELAKRLAFFHGGAISCACGGLSAAGRGEEAQGKAPAGGAVAALSLTLPFPAADGLPQRDAAEQGRPDGGLRTIGILGRVDRAALQACFPGWAMREIGLAEAGSPGFADTICPIVAIAPLSLGEEQAAALGVLLEPGAQKAARWFIAAEGFDAPAEAATAAAAGGAAAAGAAGTVPAAPADYLRRFAPAKSPDTILLLGSGEGGDETLSDLAALLRGGAEGGDAAGPAGPDRASGASRRVLRCRAPAELALLAGRETPRLIILFGERTDFVAAIEALPAFADLPLLCLAGRFADPAFAERLAERPRTAFCNSGECFGDVIVSAAERLAEGKAWLPTPTGAIIAKAIVFLNRTFREQVSRWKLSDHVAASEDYLSRIFHQQIGIPLWEYLSRLRIGYAIGLLRRSSESVAEVAARAGFQDQAYFCRVFKRVTGTTPGAVRNESGGNVRKVQ
ncbi:substrate-binding domain-containing protein [bacterium]|nr:substrate-binding domain-containing protein [bacterium]